MRILIVVARYLPHRGGLETVVREIAQHMSANGHIVRIVTNRYPRSLSKHAVVDGIPVTRMEFLYPQIGQLRARRYDLWIAGWFYLPWTLIKLIWLIYRFQPDIVNLHYLGMTGLFILIAQKVFRFRLIVSLHGGDVDGEPHHSRFNLWRFRAVLHNATSITTCSYYLLTQVLELTPDVTPKSHVIHNGVDMNLFLKANPNIHLHPYIVGVGQLVRHKGFDMLISAFARVVNDCPGYDLLIAGEGPERVALQKQIEDEELEKHVLLLGNLEREQVAQLMCGSQAVVIPSRREPFGIVGIEAMASGRVIIATRIGGLVEALNNAEVIWIEPGHDASLSDALRQVMRQEPNAQTLLDANQRLAMVYDWASVTERYMSIYLQALMP